MYFSLEGQWPGRQIAIAEEVVEWIQKSLDVVEQVESGSKGQKELQIGIHKIKTILLFC